MSELFGSLIITVGGQDKVYSLEEIEITLDSSDGAVFDKIDQLNPDAPKIPRTSMVVHRNSAQENIFVFPKTEAGSV